MLSPRPSSARNFKQEHLKIKLQLHDKHCKHHLSPQQHKIVTVARKKAFPLSGKCHTEEVVYQATVNREDNSEEKTYVCLTEGTFKTRYYNHACSFRNLKHINRTELSKYVWHLKDSNINYSIKTKWRNLCLYEKFIIIYHP